MLIDSATRRGSGNLIRPWVAGIALAVAGVALGLLILFFEPAIYAVGNVIGVRGSRGFSDTAGHFADRNETTVWIVSLCAQTGLWAALVLPLTASLRTLRDWHRRATAVRGAAILLGIFVVLVIGSAHRLVIPLPNPQVKLAIFTALGFLVAYLGALVIWRVQRAANSASRDAGDDGLAFDFYLELRATLSRVVGYLGAIISAAVLATSALHNAVITWIRAQPASAARTSAMQRFPSATKYDLLLYGLLLSGVLALIYVPAYRQVQGLGLTLLDRGCPTVWPPQADWRARSEDRAALAILLNVDPTPSSTARRVSAVLAAILAPLATSILSHALGAK